MYHNNLFFSISFYYKDKRRINQQKNKSPEANRTKIMLIATIYKTRSVIIIYLDNQGIKLLRVVRRLLIGVKYLIPILNKYITEKG